MMRVVLDANVLVSGILSAQGAPGRILDAWRAEQFQLLTSVAILEEVARVLRYPKIVKYHGWTDAEIHAFLQSLASLSLRTPGELTLDVITNDPDDNRYLECAVEGSAHYLVSGDRDLLTVETYQGIPIIAPAAFVHLLRAQA